MTTFIGNSDNFGKSWRSCAIDKGEKKDPMSDEYFKSMYEQVQNSGAKLDL